MNKIKMGLLGAFAAVAVASVASGQSVRGNKITPAVTADAGVCDVTSELAMVGMLGGDAGAGDSKLCICKSDGGAGYQWCSITLTGGSNVVCAGGSDTVCP